MSLTAPLEKIYKIHGNLCSSCFVVVTEWLFFWSYMMIDVSPYVYFSDMFVNKCQSTLIFSVPLWRGESFCYLEDRKWKQGNTDISFQGDQHEMNKSHFQKYWFDSHSVLPDFLGSDTLSRVIKHIRVEEFRFPYSLPFFVCFRHDSFNLLKLLLSCSFMNKTLVNAQNSTEHYSNFAAQWLKLKSHWADIAGLKSETHQGSAGCRKQPCKHQMKSYW